jgi:hypothetical protein
VLAGQVEQGFGQHPDAEIYRGQPGLGLILGARVLAEFGVDPGRYVDAKARKNYSGMSPITEASGTKRIVLARFAPASSGGMSRQALDAHSSASPERLSDTSGLQAAWARPRGRSGCPDLELEPVNVDPALAAHRLVGAVVDPPLTDR